MVCDETRTYRLTYHKNNVGDKERSAGNYLFPGYYLLLVGTIVQALLVGLVDQVNFHFEGKLSKFVLV
jgi:hypothetical protein